MKTPEQVTAAVTRLLARTWADDVVRETQPGVAPADGTADAAATVWPHLVALGKASSGDLAAGFSTFLHELETMRAWARLHEVELTWAERRVAGTSQQVPTHARIASIGQAAKVAGSGWPDKLALARSRAAVLRERFPHAVSTATVSAVTALGDLDFDLLCAAADWFTRNSGAGLTPRQVPIEGLHAKWLNTRHALVATLAGRDTLALLPTHPARVHFTYLDPDHRARGQRWHDAATVGDACALAYAPRVVLISENKDTAIHFPELPGAVSLEGVGRGGRTAASFGWIREAEHLIYWGDMDTDGLEILDGFRAAGLPVQSILMDEDAYRRWCRYGTDHDVKGRPLTGRAPRPTPHLTQPERALYEKLCSPELSTPRRVEQERIPLSVAAAAVRRLTDTAAPTAAP